MCRPRYPAVSKPVAEPVALAHRPACIRLGIEAVGRRGDVEPETPLKRHLKLVGLQMQRRGQHIEPGAAVVAARRDETAALAVDEGEVWVGVVDRVDRAALGEEAAPLVM